MPNHFLPLVLATLRSWNIGDSGIAMQLPTAEDRFVARWLASHTLTKEAQAEELAALKQAHDELKDKLLPQLECFGFLG